MSLEHEAPRFTPAQRDEILNLAARLQTQHEATVGTDELMRAAEEAGLAPRFVQEAAMRLGQPRQTGSYRSLVLAAFLFTLQAGLLMLNGYFWSRRGHIGLEWPDLMLAAGVSLFIASRASRTLATRRFVPLLPLAAWSALAVSVREANVLHGTPPWWVFPLAMEYVVPQMVAALVAILLAGALDRRKTDGLPRLYRA